MKNILKNLIDIYGYDNLLNTLNDMKPTGSPITDENFQDFKAAFKHFGFPITQNKNGSIIIKVANKGTNYYDYKNMNAKGIFYIIGYNEYRNGYWVRRQNGEHQFPLHYNRDSYNYDFATFDDAMEYLLKFFNKKYGK